MYLQRIALLTVVLLSTLIASAEITLTRGKNLTVSVAKDGRLAIDLLGELWIVPSSGGEAVQLSQELRSAERPRWSPDARFLVYQSNVQGSSAIGIFDIESQQTRLLTDATMNSKQPAWHPSGERIAFASTKTRREFDLWEIDIETGLTWRLTHAPGNEFDPAWSANGRDLVYVAENDGIWSLRLRRQSKPDEVLRTSRAKLSAPSFRPDGTLVTYLEEVTPPRSGANATRHLKMVILSRPRLHRTLVDNDAFDNAPVSWADRMRLIYSADGEIRKRRFGAWRSQPIHFRASHKPESADNRPTQRPTLLWPNEPDGELLLHAERLFDGLSDTYRYNVDVLLSGGKIAAISEHAEHTGAIAIDLGDLTLIPGLVDADARLPSRLRASHGPDLLTTGVTTVVGFDQRVAELNMLWSDKKAPGPRLLDANVLPLGPQPRPELAVTAAVATSRMAGGLSGHSLAAQIAILDRAGLSGAQILRALGVNAAAALKLDPYVGRIAVGASADLVFVDGDPLVDATDALNVVAVVRNGRFYSVSGLVDRAKAAENVE